MVSSGWESSMNRNRVVPERGEPTIIGIGVSGGSDELRVRKNPCTVDPKSAITSFLPSAGHTKPASNNAECASVARPRSQPKKPAPGESAASACSMRFLKITARSNDLRHPRTRFKGGRISPVHWSLFSTKNTPFHNINISSCFTLRSKL